MIKMLFTNISGRKRVAVTSTFAYKFKKICIC